MLIDSSSGHHHKVNNGPTLSNYNKVSMLNVSSNLNKMQINQKSFTQQDLNQMQAPLNSNHSVSSSISSHSSSSSSSTSSSSSSGNSSSSSTPSSLLCGSAHFNTNNTHNENEQEFNLKSDTKVIRINTKNFNLNRISAVKSINTSLNENKNANLTQLVSNHSGKIRVSSNGSIYSKQPNNNNIQQPSPQPRNPNICNYSKNTSNSNANINTIYSNNNCQSKTLKVTVKNLPSNVLNHQSSSMKNLKDISASNEIVNNQANTTSELNYNNLQMALKAATAALEKSKITASSVFTKNQVNSQSSVNISKNSAQTNDINNLPLSNKNTVSQSQSNIPNLFSLPNDLNRSNQIFVTSSTSINNLNNSTASKSGLISNNSLFQPYTKPTRDAQPLKLSQSSLATDLKS